MSERESGEAPPAPTESGESARRPESDGDIRAEFAGFYRESARKLVGFLVLQGAGVADAAEIAQDTLISAYQHWSTLRHPRAWCHRVASRALLRRISRVEEPVEQLPEPTPLLRAGGHGACPDLAEWELRHDIVTAMRLLPPRQRQVLAWTLYDHTPTEIAAELGISAEAVRANLMKARRALAEHLAETEQA